MEGRARSGAPTWALLVLLFAGLCQCDPAAEADPAAAPDAEAEPEADPDAQADPQYYGAGAAMGGYGPPPYMGGGPAVGPPGGGGMMGGGVGAGGRPASACELTNQCCGMANKRCCLGGRNCYTVWERKCDQEDNPECRVRIDQKCYGTRVKDCRIVTDVQYKTFKANVCSPKPMTRCFTYNKKVCMPSTEPAYREITWENDRLERIGEETKRHCADVKTYNCTTRMEERIVPHRIQKPILRKKLQKRCRMVQDVGPGSEVEVPVVRIVYRQMCYNMNVPQCSVSPCGAQGFCGAAQSVCAQNQFNTNTVCPLAAAAAGGGGAGVGGGAGALGPAPLGPGGPMGPVGQNCQQVRQPVCNAAPGGPCNPGSQQCCSARTQRICRQVPQRVVEKVKQRIPGTVRWREECKDFFYNVTEYIFENSNRTEKVPRRDCEPVVRNECHNVTIPQFKVVSETKRDRVTVMLPACRHRVVKDRYCHTFPGGDLDCKEQLIRRGFRINKIKCDQDRERPFCFKFPRADCRLGSNTNCRMVPRQVCTNTCSQDPQCSTCNNFVQRGPGFGSCPSSSCGNWYPGNDDADAFNQTFAGDWNAGMNALPGGGGGGGGAFYRPEAGGGGVVGGQGFYQGGAAGGQVYYPGAGGQGAYFQAGMTGPQGAGVRPYYGGGGGGGGMGVSGGPFPGATGIVGAEGDQQGGMFMDPSEGAGYPPYPGAMGGGGAGAGGYYGIGGGARAAPLSEAEEPVLGEEGGDAGDDGMAAMVAEGGDAGVASLVGDEEEEELEGVME